MFRKLTKEQSEAVAIFLIWIIAGMAFNILAPSLKAGFIGGSKYLAWTPLAASLTASLVIVVHSKASISQMNPTVFGIIGGCWGTKGIITLASTTVNFSYKSLVLGLSNLSLGCLGGYLTIRFLSLLPDIVEVNRRMKDLARQLPRIEESAEAVETATPVVMSREEELAELDRIESILLNPPEPEPWPEVEMDQLELLKYLFTGFGIVTAIGIGYSGETLLERIVMALAMLGLGPFAWILHAITKAKIARSESEFDPEEFSFTHEVLAKVNQRRAELLMHPKE